MKFISVAYNSQKKILKLKQTNRIKPQALLSTKRIPTQSKFETNKSISSVKLLGSGSSNSDELFPYQRRRTVPYRAVPSNTIRSALSPAFKPLSDPWILVISEID
ncbi:hypothetical protein ACFXTO_043901 [Malus domestica]